MAGINGFLQFNKIQNEFEIYNTIRKMNKEIIHRGPDGEEIYVDELAGLGMRISCKSRGSLKSPIIIYNESRNILIISDGSIYNYDLIKHKLQTSGHKFSTPSSMEVILHAYEEYGEKCFEYFDGTFSIAIYDIDKKQLFLARDRIGQKPLYYYKNGDLFLFGSELKSLITTNLINKEINETALHQYLQLTYIPAPYTIFKHIYKLNPGSYLKIDINSHIEANEYWDVVYDKNNLITNYSECKKLLREAVFNSVDERMKDYTSVGAFLSGGIDSTTIVGVMSKISSKPIDTFTIGFKIKDFDESDRAQLVADSFETNHHVHYLDYYDVLREIDTMVNQLDEPFGDSSAIPTYMVSKYASHYVNVVLTGDSGDELFAGYSKYLINYYGNLYIKIPSVFRKYIIERIIYKLQDNSSATRKIRKVIDNADKDIFSQRKELMCLGFKERELNLLLQKQNKIDSLDLIKQYYDKYKDTIDEISQTLYTDLKVVVEGDMMPKVDGMAMLSSLETRAPLLSREIVELAARIPSKYKINNRNQKIILKDTFGDLIPKKLLNAPKRGFGVPIGLWFRGPLKDELLEAFDESYLMEQGLFNYNFITELIEEHLSKRKNRASELWTLYVFQRWYRRYFD